MQHWLCALLLLTTQKAVQLITALAALEQVKMLCGSGIHNAEFNHASDIPQITRGRNSAFRVPHNILTPPEQCMKHSAGAVARQLFLVGTVLGSDWRSEPIKK